MNRRFHTIWKMNKQNRRSKWIFWIVLLFSILGNIVAYNHAYRLTNFSKKDVLRTDKPEELNSKEKLNALLSGITIPKPKNESIPSNYFETIRIKSFEDLEAWHIKVPNEKGTIILFHGYASSKSSMIPYSDEFNKKGYSTLLIDFMGCGNSSGSRTTIGYKESRDVKEAYEFVLNQNTSKPIILFGSSMGAVSIMKSIYEYGIRPTKIILECPFGSMLGTTKRRFDAMNLPSFPAAQILLFHAGIQHGFNPFKHNPTKYAKKINVPTLLLYGTKDERVTKHEVDEIFLNLNGHKEMTLLGNSGHEVYLDSDFLDWNSAIDSFINK